MKATIWSTEFRELCKPQSDKEFLDIVNYVDAYASELCDQNNAYLSKCVDETYKELEIAKAENAGLKERLRECLQVPVLSLIPARTASNQGRLEQIIASCYSGLGAVYDLPERFLDVLCNPLAATQEQIDALLPVESPLFTVPDSWYIFMQYCATTGGLMVNGNDLSSAAKRHLDNVAPPIVQDTGTRSINPPDFPKYMGDTFYSNAEAAYSHGCITGWRTGNFALDATQEQIDAPPAVAQDERAAWPEDPLFDEWWNADRLTQTNPYKDDTPAYWAWEGWQAAQVSASTTVLGTAQARKEADHGCPKQTSYGEAICEKRMEKEAERHSAENPVVDQSSADTLRAARLEKYDRLLLAVIRKHAGETRHQTALRYIREAEENATADGSAKGAKK